MEGWDADDYAAAGIAMDREAQDRADHWQGIAEREATLVEELHAEIERLAGA